MKNKETDIVHEIVAEIGVRFSTFGGGIDTGSIGSLSDLRNRPLQFASGVKVADVVRLVLAMADRAKQDSDR